MKSSCYFQIQSGKVKLWKEITSENQEPPNLLLNTIIVCDSDHNEKYYLIVTLRNRIL